MRELMYASLPFWIGAASGALILLAIERPFNFFSLQAVIIGVMLAISWWCGSCVN